MPSLSDLVIELGRLRSQVARHGSGRLTKSGSNLLYAPYNGNLITAGGTFQEVPDAGITLSASGAAASTLYYIYIYRSSGVLTLEASTTGHATQAGTGVEIKSGDGTRTLVGMARTTAGTAWADAASQRLVRSWFNRRPMTAANGYTSANGTSSTAWIELSSSARAEVVLWADDVLAIEVAGAVYANTIETACMTSVGIDSATVPEDVLSHQTAPAANYRMSAGLAFSKSGLADGYHFVALLHAVGANTATWEGAAAGAGSQRVTLRATVQ